MKRSRFVRPDVKVLNISQGDTLTVKRKLNTGDQREAFARMAVPGLDGAMKIDSSKVGIELVVAYLVDWSLTDDDGRLVEVRGKSPEEILAAVNDLDPDDFAEIRDAISAHDDAVRTRREQEKNDQDGGSGSPAISPSPSDAAGATSGSPS